MKQLKALDLFCGAGGAAKGMQRADFHVTGVDIKPQPRYCGDAFIQGDALEADLSGYDFVWASPPCQSYSAATKHLSTKKAAMLIPQMRGKLMKESKIWIMENVVGAPLLNPMLLCGAMFGLKLYRHRHFECSHFFLCPPHHGHPVKCSPAGHWKPGTYVSVAGNCSPIALAKQSMGIDWMSRQELAESIPPAYSEFLCRQIKKILLPA
jgi:DNA (cytosine-5)-methyltransferase 1